LLWWSLILIWFAIHYTSTSPEYRYPNFRHCYVYIADKYLVGLEILYGAAGEYNWKSTHAGRGLSYPSLYRQGSWVADISICSRFFPHHLLADSVRFHSFFFSFYYLLRHHVNAVRKPAAGKANRNGLVANERAKMMVCTWHTHITKQQLIVFTRLFPI
jgi:hypothetical protein